MPAAPATAAIAVNLVPVPVQPRVFAGQLIGLAVLGPTGESLGRVRDLLAGLRLDRQPPRVLGLVVELVTRRRIFVPMLRVTSIEADAIRLGTDSVDLRPFHQRQGEVLVIGQLLDARVDIGDERTPSGVVDVAMEPTRTRDWVLSRVAVRRRPHRLGRRGPIQIMPWTAVRGLDAVKVAHQAHDAHHLLTVFDTMRAVDVASALRDLPVKRRHQIADALDDERLADILEELSEHDQKDLLAHLDEQRAADVLEAMNPDDAADLLGELSEVEKERLLHLMQPQEAAPLRRLLAYSADTAGGLMTPEPVVLAPDANVAEALARVRNPDLTPALASMVFVCRRPSATPTGQYLGCVHFQRLLREPPTELVAGVADTNLAQLSPTAPLGEVTRYFAAYNLVCGPVVDGQGHLLGAVTVDDVLDHLLPAGWREGSDLDDLIRRHDPAT